MRLLAIPALTKLAAASPFHCCLVPPAQRNLLTSSRTLVTNEVSPNFNLRSVTAVTGLCGIPGAEHLQVSCWLSRRVDAFDKAGRGQENRRFTAPTKDLP